MWRPFLISLRAGSPRAIPCGSAALPSRVYLIPVHNRVAVRTAGAVGAVDGVRVRRVRDVSLGRCAVTPQRHGAGRGRVHVAAWAEAPWPGAVLARVLGEVDMAGWAPRAGWNCGICLPGAVGSGRAGRGGPGADRWLRKERCLGGAWVCTRWCGRARSSMLCRRMRVGIARMLRCSVRGRGVAGLLFVMRGGLKRGAVRQRTRVFSVGVYEEVGMGLRGIHWVGACMGSRYDVLLGGGVLGL